MDDDGEVTRLLQDLPDGSKAAAERLSPRVYAELGGAAARLDLRSFGGLELEGIPEALDISLASVNRDGRMARAFLANALA